MKWNESTLNKRQERYEINDNVNQNQEQRIRYIREFHNYI